MIVQSDKLNKKEAILRSTLELIMDNGFHGTPISLITKHAGVAAGTIYHYFPSKDAIILELHSLIRDEIAAAMLLDNPDYGDFKKQFFDGWINLCQYFIRSEEHTSELQSLRHLVCRLLLEKKDIDRGQVGFGVVVVVIRDEIFDTVVREKALEFAIFFFNEAAATEIYTLPLHDALPIWGRRPSPRRRTRGRSARTSSRPGRRSGPPGRKRAGPAPPPPAGQSPCAAEASG